MFRVDWLQAALDELTALWLQVDTTQRQRITAASHDIDQRLASDPLNEGESRPGGQRIAFIGPLTIRFQVEGDGQTVTVLHVNMVRPRKK